MTSNQQSASRPAADRLAHFGWSRGRIADESGLDVGTVGDMLHAEMSPGACRHNTVSAITVSTPGMQRKPAEHTSHHQVVEKRDGKSSRTLPGRKTDVRDAELRCCTAPLTAAVKNGVRGA